MIGIVYIVVYIHKSLYSYDVNEGFQGLICPKTMVGGRDTYICKNPDDAYTLLESGRSENNPVCYTDSNDIHLSRLDENNSVFVCFDINGDPQLDPTTGVYRPFNPVLDDDPLPSFGRQNAIINSATFKSGYNSFGGSYSNTSTIANNISTIGYVGASNVLSTIVKLKDTYCTGTPSGRYVDPCITINRAFTNVNGYLTDTSPSSLKHINSVMKESTEQISNAYYKLFIPGFYNSHVMSTPQITDYLDKKSRH